MDFQRIWRDQKVPSAVMDEMVNITKIVNDAINDPNRDTVNVTQWCKRAECWKRMQNSCTYSLRNKILDCCISRDEELADRASARKDIKEDIGIAAETEVFEYGAENWKRLQTFANERHLINSQNEVQALAAGAQIPNKIPNSFQAKLLLKLRERALNEGFRK